MHKVMLTVNKKMHICAQSFIIPDVHLRETVYAGIWSRVSYTILETK